jgi:plastocyanin
MSRLFRVGALAGLASLAGFLGVERASAAEHVVTVADYKYSPAEVRVKPGDTVTWVNQERRTSHSVLFEQTGEESVRFFPDEKWSRVFPQAGRFEYRCGPHPEMKGVVVVE